MQIVIVDVFMFIRSSPFHSSLTPFLTGCILRGGTRFGGMLALSWPLDTGKRVLDHRKPAL